MNRLLSALIVLPLVISCQDDLLPARIVFGEPSQSMVFNLQLADPGIAGKSVTLTNNAEGKARIVANGKFIIYDAGPDFEQDEVEVRANNEPVLLVKFLRPDLNEVCKSFARSYDIVVKKNSPTITMGLELPKFCDQSVNKNPTLFITSLTPIPGLGFESSSFRTNMVFWPTPDFVGEGETIYELGFSPLGTRSVSGDYNEMRLVVSGLVKIRVEE